MLFILSGDIQTGKTRWLQALVEELARESISCYGVLSPGIWRERETVTDAGQRVIEYEKLGIETVFLPSMECLPFAERRDLTESTGGFCGERAGWQSVKARLGWVIPDKAIGAINRHFDAISKSCTACEARGASEPDQPLKPSQPNPPNKPNPPNPPYQPNKPSGLLIVDELGRLELCEGTGFVSAIQLLKRGSTSLYKHALVVARTGLAQLARGCLSPYWDKTIIISPDKDMQKMLTSLIEG
jgi:hypothetical protein